MNITMRKLAMLEKDFEKRAEESKVMGYSTMPYDVNLHQKITKLMDRVRVI